MRIQQKLVTISENFAEYLNFFSYGHETRRMLHEGWYVKHIHDDQARQTAWILYERQLPQSDKDTEIKA
jgi:hypothetical protein